MMKRQLAFLPLILLTACTPAKPSSNSQAEAFHAVAPTPQNVTQPKKRLEATQTVQPSPRIHAAKAPQVQAKAPMHVRGLYVNQASLRGPRLARLLTFMHQHGLNAMVVDVKDDYGRVTLTQSTRQTVQALKAQHLYLIARIVVFKDPKLARSQPSLAIAERGGGLWTQQGVPWVDPYKPQVWSYNVQIAKRAIAAGFDEIQWDYVRFPDGSRTALSKARFDNPKGVSKSNEIAAFLRHARRNLQHVRISADVFGLVTSAADDMGIGQVWEKMAPNVDVISPMMYPSHYGPGIYGLANPERSPYRTIEKGLQDAIHRNRVLAQRHAPAPGIRPWLQDFDMRVPYNRREVEHQIQAASALGIQDYLLWNQANRYSW